MEPNDHLKLMIGDLFMSLAVLRAENDAIKAKEARDERPAS
jgi:hypothetical protein